MRLHPRTPLSTALTIAACCVGLGCSADEVGSSSSEVHAGRDSWTAVGELHKERFYATVAALHDGGALMVGGASAFGGATVLEDADHNAPCERYDAETRTWTEVASLPGKRQQVFAVTLDDGRVLAGGGNNQTALPGLANFLNDSYIYDPDRNKWEVTGALPFGIAWIQNNSPAVLLRDGRVLVFGAANHADDDPNDPNLFLDGTVLRLKASLRTATYDPETGIWTEQGLMNARRHQATATVMQNGRVLVAGGTPALPGPNQFVEAHATAEVFDPSTNEWTAVAPMPPVAIDGAAASGSGARVRVTSALLPGNRVLIAGGRYAGVVRRSALIYDDSSGTWTEAAPMNEARFQTVLVPVKQGGDVIAVMGRGLTGTLEFDLATSEIYDRQHDRWSPIAEAPHVQSAFLTVPLARLSSGEILTAGGRAYGAASTAAITASYLYTPDRPGH